MNSLVRRVEALPPRIQDGALAVVVAAVESSLLWVYPPEMLAIEGFTGPTPLAVMVIVGMSIPLVWRRRAPMAVLMASLVMAGLSVALVVPSQMFGPLAAFYTVAAHTSRSRSLAAFGGVVVFSGILVWWADGSLTNLPIQLIVVGTAWLLGDAQRARGEHAALLMERAEQLVVERERSAELAVRQERARIARELHDVVAHTVSVMVVQAAAARRVMPSDLERARAAARQVADTGRQTLQELRRLLGVLTVGEPAAQPVPQMAPQPGLADLDELVGQVAAAPLRVRVRTTGVPRLLASGVDLSAYRIIQESLTNAIKHSGARAVEILLEFRPESLAITVTDDGHGPPAVPSEGHGLVGMRERAGLVGGSLETGPGPDGGFRVHAILPVEPAGHKEVNA